jgi:hypothetical protein
MEAIRLSLRDGYGYFALSGIEPLPPSLQTISACATADHKLRCWPVVGRNSASSISPRS